MTPWVDEPIVSIILAGGKGSRMRNDAVHKMCFEVGGVHVILRSLQTYQQCGIDHHVIVIGALGEQVIHTVGSRVSNTGWCSWSSAIA